MHCSFELSQVTLPILARPFCCSRRHRQWAGPAGVREETEAGRKRSRPEGGEKREKKREERRDEEDRREEERALKEERWWNRRRQAISTSIARPHPNQSLTLCGSSSVCRSVGRSSSGNRRRRAAEAPHYFLHLRGSRRPRRRRRYRQGHRLPPALPCIVANEGQSM